MPLTHLLVKNKKMFNQVNYKVIKIKLVIRDQGKLYQIVSLNYCNTKKEKQIV